MTFQDRFNGSGTGQKAFTKWYDGWGGVSSTRCTDHYGSRGNTGFQVDNASESGGVANLRLTHVPCVTPGHRTEPYSGATINTSPAENGPHFTQKYGFFQAQIYVPAASHGTSANWPAWWMMSSPWVNEIDIAEGKGGKVCFTVHVKSGYSPTRCPAGNWTGWHTYGVDWTASGATFYYDGKDVGTDAYKMPTPMLLVLSNATGYLAGPTVTPADLRVNYVRGWRHSQP